MIEACTTRPAHVSEWVAFSAAARPITAQYPARSPIAGMPCSARWLISVMITSANPSNTANSSQFAGTGTSAWTRATVAMP